MAGMNHFLLHLFGRKRVFFQGSFDLLHYGHRFNAVIDFLELLKIKTIAKIMEEIEGVRKDKSILAARKYLRQP